MNYRRWLWVAVLVALMWGVFEVLNPRQKVRADLDAMNRKRVELALFALEANLPGPGEGGYVRHTPSSAAARIVQTLNAAQELSPQEKDELRKTGARFMPKPIPYRLGAPDAFWQVVLKPDDAAGKIRAEVYGLSLASPVEVKEYRCCE
jgi:hypothetical protein